MDSMYVSVGAESFEPPNCRRIGYILADCSVFDGNDTGGHRKKKPDIQLDGIVEIDEVYVVCGHKGQPDKVAKIGRAGRCRRLKGKRGRGTLKAEKPPVLGMVQRGGMLSVRMLADVQQETIKPIILNRIKKGTLIYTDEYNIYGRLKHWGYKHKTVCHAAGEYARDEDGDGFHEVHVNTQEGIWSVLRSWLRPHRGISQSKMPAYLAFFEFVYNAKKRGKAILGALFETVLLPDKCRSCAQATSP